MADIDDKALEAALASAVRTLWSGPDREQLSVNTVRKQVEDEQGLEAGFFAGPEWKGRSKGIIKDTVVCSMCFLLLPAVAAIFSPTIVGSEH